MRKNQIVYWLIPAEPEGQLFRALIRILAKQCDGPRFKPHLTIFATPQDRQSPAKILRRLKAKPIRLKVSGVSYSEQFTKTLYVQFGSNKEFEKLAVDLGRVAGLRIKAPAHPHLSLLYKDIPAAAKKQLASTLKLPIREVVFDTIKAVRCAAPTQTRGDVESWRVLAKKRLK
jgi:2'-5' RNA ligase